MDFVHCLQFSDHKLHRHFVEKHIFTNADPANISCDSLSLRDLSLHTIFLYNDPDDSDVNYRAWMFYKTKRTRVRQYHVTLTNFMSKLGTIHYGGLVIIVKFLDRGCQYAVSILPTDIIFSRMTHTYSPGLSKWINTSKATTISGRICADEPEQTDLSE